MRITRRGVIFIAMLLVTVALDQGSKTWARTLPVQPAGCTTPRSLPMTAAACHSPSSRATGTGARAQ
jgi:hypothetical protein